jgi:hypothetical protein
MEQIVNLSTACQAPSCRTTGASRRCLNCGEAFPSEGPFNRICAACKSNEGSDGIGDHTLHLPADPRGE